MGRAWNGVCYDTDAQALDAFARSAATSDGSGIASFTAAPTINNGLITWSIKHRPLTTTSGSVRSDNLQLLNCTPTMEQWPLETIVWILALFFAALFGFRSGFRP